MCLSLYTFLQYLNFFFNQAPLWCFQLKKTIFSAACHAVTVLCGSPPDLLGGEGREPELFFLRGENGSVHDTLGVGSHILWTTCASKLGS